jgi:hypothetical protein
LMNFPIRWTSLETMSDEYFRDWAEKSTASIPDSGGRPVRSLWWDEDPSETPYRPQSDEQQPEQHRSSLRRLSCERASDIAAKEMRDLRVGVSAETQQEGNAVRVCAMPERKGETISRVAVGISARVDRLKCLGNGQVPQCAALAWSILSSDLCYAVYS